MSLPTRLRNKVAQQGALTIANPRRFPSASGGMAPLVGGLLDPHLDLALLSLSLATPSHRPLVHSALLRPPLPLPSPSLPPLSSSPSSASSSAPSHLLIVPHLRLPWASTLCETVWRVFHVSLVPLCTGPLLSIDVFLSTLSSSPPSNSFRSALLSSSFYPRLPAADVMRNAATLRHIRAVYPARSLEHVAICVRLAYANTLLPSLQRSIVSTRDEIDTLTATKQDCMKDEDNAHSAQDAHCGEPATGRAVAKRPGAAEVGCIRATPPGPSRRTSPPGPRRVPMQHMCIRAHEIPNAKTGAYLLHGVVVGADVLPTVSRLLRGYGIGVVTDMPREAGISLAALSNRGGGLLRQHREIPQARGPCVVDDDIDSYTMRAYGTGWSQLCGFVVEEGRLQVTKERVEELEKNMTRLGAAVKWMEQVREELIGRAIQHEIGGCSLSKMCAFAIAQGGLDEEFERRMSLFSDEYVADVVGAGGRLKQLRGIDSRNADALVGL